MRISFSPQLRGETLAIERIDTDQLSINGALFDFSSLPNGATVPAGAVPCDWIVGPVERIESELHLTLLLPHGDNPSEAVAFPETITVSENGPIAVPHDPVPDIPEPDMPAMEEQPGAGDDNVDA